MYQTTRIKPYACFHQICTCNMLLFHIGYTYILLHSPQEITKAQGVEYRVCAPGFSIVHYIIPNLFTVELGKGIWACWGVGGLVL